MGNTNKNKNLFRNQKVAIAIVPATFLTILSSMIWRDSNVNVQLVILRAGVFFAALFISNHCLATGVKGIFLMTCIWYNETGTDVLCMRMGLAHLEKRCSEKVQRELYVVCLK